MMQTATQYIRWLCAVGLTAALSPTFGQTHSLVTEIGKILKHESPVDFDLVPGILVGVLFKDTSYICSFGHSMSPDSMYELGGVTQPIVYGLAIHALDSLGIALTDPVCLILPDSLCSEAWQTITINHLLEHTAGLPRLPPSLGMTGAPVTDPFAAYDADELASDVQAISPVRDRFSYSYLGYGMLFWLFERVGGLESFSERWMTQPLHMQNTIWTVADARIAYGVGLDGQPQSTWHCAALAPAIGLKSSMHDLLIWLRREAEEQKTHPTQTTRSVKKATRSADKPQSAEAGWFILKRGSKIYYFHAGRSGRHHLSIALIPGMDRAVIVISNGASGSGDLSLSILDMLIQAR